MEEDKITWCSNPSHKLGNMPKGLEEEITGVSNVCYTLHNGALRVWKRIELHGTQMRAWLVAYAGLEEDEITWYSNTCYTLMKNYRALKFGNTVLRRFGEG